MNMYLHELRAYRKSTIIWTISIVTVLAVMLSMFPSFSNPSTQASIKTALQSFPEAVRKALGISIDMVTSILGFYSYLFLYVSLCGAIQAMNLGTSIISKEVREKTADFLLTKPVSRKQIVTAKLLAALTELVITNVVFTVAAFVICEMVKNKEFSINIFLLITFSLFFIQMMFMALGVIVSVVMKKIKTVITISLSTVFVFFIISMFGSVIGDKAIRYVTPFKYFDSTYIINNGGYEASYLIVGVMFIIISTVASYYIYIKKDIHAV